MKKPYIYTVCAIVATLLLGATVSYTQDGPPGARRGGGGPRDMMRMLPVMTALDADGDGALSAEEINNASAALRKLDKNGDGKLTEGELRPNFPQGGPGGRGPGGPGGGVNTDEMIKQLLEFDKNGDGQLQKSEVPERMSGLFERGDTNKDGVLSKEELRKLAEAQSGGARGDDHDEHREGERRPQRPTGN
jgi:Ca2+-binding EF-hand superfamily protein